MKKMVALVISCILCMMVGYQVGVNRATTSEGWAENGSFLLDVDGQVYEWIIDDYGEQPQSPAKNKIVNKIVILSLLICNKSMLY